MQNAPHEPGDPGVVPLGDNPDFRKLWFAQTISIFGSLVTRIAVPFAALLVLDAEPIHLGLLYAAEIVPGSGSGSRSRSLGRSISPPPGAHRD